MVACFAPEWNSHNVNKTRSFNILRAIHACGMPSSAAFAPAEQSPRPQPCAASGEVFMISGGGFCRQPLKNQEIEFRRLPRDGSAPISGAHLADRARLSENSSSRKLPWWGTSFHLCPCYRWHYLLPSLYMPIWPPANTRTASNYDDGETHINLFASRSSSGSL